MTSPSDIVDSEFNVGYMSDNASTTLIFLSPIAHDYIFMNSSRYHQFRGDYQFRDDHRDENGGNGTT